MEYLYLNIHTGAYWASTRNVKTNPDDWENPVSGLTVFSCQSDKDNHIHLSYYDSHSRPNNNIAVTGWLLVSEKHRDRFRWVRNYHRPTFYQPIDYRLPDIHSCVIEPLDGTRMPEPGAVLDIIPEGTNAKSSR